MLKSLAYFCELKVNNRDLTLLISLFMDLAVYKLLEFLFRCFNQIGDFSCFGSNVQREFVIIVKKTFFNSFLLHFSKFTHYS